MAVVQSAGSVLDVQRPWYPSSGLGRGVALYEGVYQDYAAIWRTQPNVRTVVGFLARNVAQLGLHVFDRVSDDERRRITDGVAGSWLRRPTPSPRISLYDLINWFVHDLCVFDDAFWAKVKAPSSGAVATVPLPPQNIELIGGGLLDPDAYRLHGSRGWRDLAPDEVVHVHGYNPDDRRHGVSPMETLRRIIAEDLAAGRYREKFWLNSTRIEGVLKQPADARKPLSDLARARVKADWQAAYAGNGPDAGGTPLLEEGLDFVPTSFSAKDAEYVAARKLTREEVAAAFWVHPAMVGIMEHANFANMREQHRSTYQDTLGPIMRQLSAAFDLQLAPDLGLGPSAYFEFNIKEKLRGSFEEEAAALQTAVGAPTMTRNEGRARQNLPPIEGGDELVTPLNVLIGGQASPTDSGSQNVRGRRSFKALPGEAEGYIAKHREVLEGFFARQREAVLARVGSEKARGTKATLAEVFDRQRWDDELTVDLLALALATAQQSGDEVVSLFGGTWDVTEVAGLYEALEESSRGMAESINDWTEDHLGDALAEDDPVAATRSVFVGLVEARAAVYAASRVSTVWNFSRGVAAKASGAGFKRWRVTSGNPRSAHAALDGETVAIGETFSNGAAWPGDPVLPVEERANCACTFDVLTEAATA